MRLEVELAEAQQQLGRMEELEKELQKYRWVLEARVVLQGSGVCWAGVWRVAQGGRWLEVGGWLPALESPGGYGGDASRIFAAPSCNALLFCTSSLALLPHSLMPARRLSSPGTVFHAPCALLWPPAPASRLSSNEKKGSGIWGYISGSQS